jgi:glycosyltransferase involved in cell wall biosynthesis
MEPVAAFTDSYLPTVNGVTYTVQTWRDRWRARGGRMEVVYPGVEEYDPEPGEYPVRSLPFPFYEGFRLGVPRVPRAVRDASVVHAHTPFALGLAGLRMARRENLPLVASYHTPSSEYADYLTSSERIERDIERLSRRYERWFFGRADTVLAPSEATRRHLRGEVGVDTEVIVLPNGVDTDRFRPVDAAGFRERHDLGDGPLVGYTGRHGYEKCLSDAVAAAAGLDVTVVFGGDGPAREGLEAEADQHGLDARFLGFLDRGELPAFYSALDVFLFPSPVETEGLVALEAIACGTPVVGVNEGALATTIDHEETGYHFDPGDVAGFREAIRRALDERDRLREHCLAHRDAVSVEHSLDRLDGIYGRLV